MAWNDDGHHDVFISYSTLNKPVADAACATLEAQGIRCWIAPRDIMPSEDWSDAIIDAIAACRVFVLILSTASNLSEQVKREVQNAVSEAKFILPMRIEDVALSKHMRYFIGTPHWLDALTPPMEAHLLRMAETIRGLLEKPDVKAGAGPPPVPSPPPAPSPTQPPRPAAAWDADILARITGELRQFVGPISSALVREAANFAVDYEGLCHRLARNELQEQERPAFLNKCLPLVPPPPEGAVAGGPEPVAATAKSPATGAGLDPETVAAAAKALALYAGPLAKFLAKQAAKDATDKEDFYRRLSEEVSSPKEKADFLRLLER